jgi:hypothetical protein
MVQQMNNLPNNVVGFRAVGEVNKEDFTDIIMPEVKKQVEKTGKLNYMLVLEDTAEDWTAGAWMQDALLGIKNLSKWNRAAIVSSSKGIEKFTNAFSKVVPGEFKGFAKNELNQAIDWVSEKRNLA